MATKKFSVTALIESTPQNVYSILSDYNISHPMILPKPPFVSLKIEKGGFGPGTEMIVEMKMFGKVQSFRAVVTELEPGRVLVETTDTGYITTFTVEPCDSGKNSYVTFTTELTENPGFGKRIEFWLTIKLLTPVYKKELEKLAEVAANRTAIS
jgi:hypothetical protein